MKTPKTIIFTLVRESSYAHPLWKSDDPSSGHQTLSTFELVPPPAGPSQPQPSPSLESPPVKTAPLPKKQRMAEETAISQLRQELSAALAKNAALQQQNAALQEQLNSHHSSSPHSPSNPPSSERDDDCLGLEAALDSEVDSQWEGSDNDHNVGERAQPMHIVYLQDEQSPEALELARARGLDIDAWCHLYTPSILYQLSSPCSQQGGVGQAVNKHSPSRPLQRSFFNPQYFSFLGSQTGGALGRGVAIGNNKWGIPKSERGNEVTLNCNVDWVDLFLPWTFSVVGGSTEYQVTLPPSLPLSPPSLSLSLGPPPLYGH